MHFDELRRAVAAASRDALSHVTALIWRAFGEALITEEQAGELSGMIEARKVAPARPDPARVGSRPRTDASLERRRRWSASGLMPPAIAGHFTNGEQAALAVIALEVGRTGDCRWPLARIAAVAGISVSTVKRALREAKALGLIEVEERRVSWWRNDSNVVRITSPSWVAWLSRRGGVQPWPRTVIGRSTDTSERTGERSKGYRDQAGGDRKRQDSPRIARAALGRRSADPACG